MLEDYNNEEEESYYYWFWDDVLIIDPCLSWEFCACKSSLVAYWPTGKKQEQFTRCLDCGDINFTMTVFATSN